MAKPVTDYPPNTVLVHPSYGTVIFVADCGTFRQACIQVRRVGEMDVIHVDPAAVTPVGKVKA